MTKFVQLSLFAAVAVSATQAAAQTTWHRDGKGYSTKSGQTLYFVRYDGKSSTHITHGNRVYRYYRDGTTGVTTFSKTGRLDYYRNAKTGWWQSSYTPYRYRQRRAAAGYTGYRTAPQQAAASWEGGRRAWSSPPAGNWQQRGTQSRGESRPPNRWWGRSYRDRQPPQQKLGRRPKRPAQDATAGAESAATSESSEDSASERADEASPSDEEPSIDDSPEA